MIYKINKNINYVIVSKQFPYSNYNLLNKKTEVATE